MELKQLNAFIAIVEVKSFSAAAKLTGLSQPSLSRLIKQLETEMSVELIDRYHRPLQLTPAGQFFYDKISTVMTEIDTITSMTQRLSAPSNRLNIGFVPSVLYGLLPEVIATLKHHNPDIEVSLKDISSYQQFESLKKGVIDVGFGRFTLQEIGVKQILLRHERYMVALPKTHSLAHIENQRLIDLVDNHLILYHQTHLPSALSHETSDPNQSMAHSETEPLLHLFAHYGISPFTTTTVSDLQVALGLVAAGEGITLVPASLQTVRTEQIVYQRLVHENATSPIYLHTLKDYFHPKIPVLLNAIYDVYEKHGITYRRQQFE